MADEEGYNQSKQVIQTGDGSGKFLLLEAALDMVSSLAFRIAQ